MDNRPYIEAVMEDSRSKLEQAGVAAYVIDAFTAETFEEGGRVYPFYDVPDIDGGKLERLGILCAVSKRYLEHYGTGTLLEHFLADEWRRLEREAIVPLVAASKGGQKKRGTKGPVKQTILRFMEALGEDLSFKDLIGGMASERTCDRVFERENSAGQAHPWIFDVSHEGERIILCDLNGKEKKVTFKTVKTALSEIRNEK